MHREKPDSDGEAGKDVTSLGVIISPEEIRKVHDEVIKFGGEPGIRERGTLDFIQYRVHRELLKEARNGRLSPEKLAGSLLYYIATKHPFLDGNKRTGFIVADAILCESGYSRRLPDSEKIDFLRRLAEYKIGLDEVVAWLETNYERNPKARYSIGFDPKDYRMFVLRSEG